MQDSAQSAVMQDIYDYSKTQVMTFVCISLPDHSPLVFGNVGWCQSIGIKGGVQQLCHFICKQPILLICLWWISVCFAQTGAILKWHDMAPQGSSGFPHQALCSTLPPLLLEEAWLWGNRLQTCPQTHRRFQLAVGNVAGQMALAGCIHECKRTPCPPLALLLVFDFLIM